MAFRFRLVMGGLCAFVPSTDGRVLRALMLSTHGRDFSTLVTHAPDEHTPTLLYDRADEAGAVSSRPGVWPLIDEEITIPVPQPSPLRLVGLTGSTKEGNPGLLDRDLDWVPGIRSILTNAGPLLSGCLGPNPSPLLSARVHIDHGKVEVDQFAKFQGKEVVADFQPRPAGAEVKKQVIPHRVAWEIDVPDDPPLPTGEPAPPPSLTIRSRRFSEQGVFPIIKFQPAPGKAVVEVLLVNLCCGNYLTAVEPLRLEPDDDFECFYTLLENFDDLKARFAPLPIPVGIDHPLVLVTNRPPRGTSGGIKCTMAQFPPQDPPAQA